MKKVFFPYEGRGGYGKNGFSLQGGDGAVSQKVILHDKGDREGPDLTNKDESLLNST